MSNFMYKYIKQDQCGFVKGRQMSNLIGRVINKIQTIEGEKNKAGILALDIFKAFDSVEWPTIQTIMNKFGLGKRFKNIMSQLYSDNYTKIILNDGITGEIKVTRGTRHGCPVSPILFAMVMELLANVIRKDKELEGIGTKLGKISLFADDTLITIKEIMKKMEIIKKHLTEFEWATGLKINWNKSEAMLFNYTKQEEEEFKKQMDIKDMRISVKENIKYLGIIITKDLKSIERKNLEELRKHMEVKLKDYNNLRLSWFGRIALVKMKVLPKINFLFRMIPLMISEKEINNWQQMINKYCNNGKKNRLNKQIWYKPQKEGGLGLPNIKKYYEANQLRYVVEKMMDGEGLEWMESGNKAIEWRKDNIFFKEISKKEIKQIGNISLRNKMEMWNKYKGQLINKNSVLTPIIMEKDFPKELKGTLDKELEKRELKRVGNWIEQKMEKVKMREELRGINIYWIHWIQLEKWNENWWARNKTGKQITQFEELIIKALKRGNSEPLKGTTSKIYKILIKDIEKKKRLTLRESWEEELGTKITERIRIIMKNAGEGARKLEPTCICGGIVNM
uniref:Reverse transcriptase domain-containing protein n=1 Tax=Anolis carolinensis TaxID=28377 RepID=G1KYS4_ANOCA